MADKKVQLKDAVGNLLYPKIKTSNVINDANYVTSDQLANAIAAKLTYVEVESLPSSNILLNTVYLVTKAAGETGNLYDEYMYINSKWELLGDKAVSLADYYNKSQVDNLVNAKAALSHTHAQSEITGLVTALAGKSATGHTHTSSDITDFATTVQSLAPKDHTHTFDAILSPSDASITLTSVLAGKSDVGHTHLAADVKYTYTYSGAPSTQYTVAQILEDLKTTNNAQATSITNLESSKANTSHTHAIADVTNLQTTLNGKSATGHTHVMADVTDLAAAMNGKANTSHTHAIADVTNLQTTLNNKAALSHTHLATEVTYKDTDSSTAVVLQTYLRDEHSALDTRIINSESTIYSTVESTYRRKDTPIYFADVLKSSTESSVTLVSYVTGLTTPIANHTVSTNTSAHTTDNIATTGAVTSLFTGATITDTFGSIYGAISTKADSSHFHTTDDITIGNITTTYGGNDTSINTILTGMDTDIQSALGSVGANRVTISSSAGTTLDTLVSALDSSSSTFSHQHTGASVTLSGTYSTVQALADALATTFAAISHTHTSSNVIMADGSTTVEDAINGKAASAHTHVGADVTVTYKASSYTTNLNNALTTIDARIDSTNSTVATKAAIASPALTGTPTTPTPTASSADGMIANKAYVDGLITNLVGSSITFEVID